LVLQDQRAGRSAKVQLFLFSVQRLTAERYRSLCGRDGCAVLLQCELRNVPVINSTAENRLVGSLSRAEALAIFSEAIAEKSKPTG